MYNFMYNFILWFLPPHPLWLEGAPLPTERAPVLTAEMGAHHKLRSQYCHMMGQEGK